MRTRITIIGIPCGVQSFKRRAGNPIAAPGGSRALRRQTDPAADAFATGREAPVTVRRLRELASWNSTGRIAALRRADPFLGGSSHPTTARRVLPDAGPLAHVWAPAPT